MTSALWLLGSGVRESPSPLMQSSALRACGLDWSYSICDVAPSGLREAVDRLRSGEAVGANVTIPHKRAAALLCDRLEGDAQLIGAVNTLVVRDRVLIGDNTDARGLEAALWHEGLWPRAGSSVVVLGAGGAAAAALLALSRSRPARLSLAARRAEATMETVARLAAFSVRPVEWSRAGVLNALGSQPVLVNATPAGIDALPVPVDALPLGCTVIDLRYRPRPVDLVAAARARGLRACDGLEMLLQQGMLSFRLWTGCEPPLDVARAALLENLSAPSDPEKSSSAPSDPEDFLSPPSDPITTDGSALPR